MTQIPSTDWFAINPLLVAGSPYHFGLGGDASLVQSASFFWDSALIGGITIWTCDFRETRIALTDTAAGHWIQQQPTSGYTAISPAGAATLGASPLIITIPGGVAGGCNIQLGNFGSARLKAIVTVTAQGAFAYAWNGKE